MIRHSLGLLLLAVTASAFGGDLDDLNPTIAKAPPLSSKEARYGLLTFGPVDQFKAWLIMDGKVAYFDRNGNGDLTEPAERFEAVAEGDRNGQKYITFRFGKFSFPGDSTSYEAGLTHLVSEQGQEADTILVRSDDKIFQDVGMIFGKGYRLGNQAQGAPVLHFNAPLTLTLRMDFEAELHYGFPPNDIDFEPLIQAGAVADRIGFLVVHHIGTPSQGKGNFVSNHWGGVKDNEGPLAELEFANRRPDQPPIKVKAHPTGRSCKEGFMGIFEFPADAAGGQVQLSLSYPDWKDDWATDVMRKFSISPSTEIVTISRSQPDPTP